MITINDILAKKGNEKLTMVTAYDYPTAKLVDESGVDMILVGDSLGMVVLGYDSTLPVSVDEMIHHAKAVNRGRKNSFLVVDMPYLSYNVDKRDTAYNAGRIIKETGAQAVKVEGGRTNTIETIELLVELDIPVMGHLGLTPQSVNKMGGYKIQGKGADVAEQMIENAVQLEKAGVFSMVLEGIPENLGKLISEKVSVPTIGIGAGKYTDGQVLVFHDMLGVNEQVPKFVKKYSDLKEEVSTSIRKYIDEVKTGEFPSEENIYKAKADLSRIY